MTFIANTGTRNDGRKGHFGIAAQTEPGLYVPPTNYLRETGGTGYMPDELERMSQAFRGTSFESPAEYAGTDYMNRSVPTEATVNDVALALKLMYGQPDVSSIITPQDATQWSPNFPLQPFSGQWRVPGAGHVQFRDAQLYELTLTVPEARTEFVGAVMNFHAAWALHHPEGAPIAPFTPAVPVIPGYSGGLGRNDHTFTFDGVAYCPDGTSVARFYNPVDGLPACGETIPGFGPGTDPIGVEFQFGFNRPLPNLLAASKSKAFIPVVWKLERAGKVIEVTASVQVSAREVPVAAGRVRTTATVRARAQTPGVSPFSIKVLTT
ncbi:hypothetical protein [Deinococcus arenicola]|uniref:Uncharacterized protein n=1 Tax=Deinococcus arenicola TaxID=2994950 RepID=A0ABU4DUY8_9DEIO|nr:hypothetical protein [Deinococcus sp. ZS9-10]MDV6376247.1 hypothetical protein [Deinococcus sp. ZS9-10]